MQGQVGKRIRELRLAMGMTQEAAAELAKVNGKYFGAIERGEVNVNLATLVRVAEALQVLPSDLLVSETSPAKDDRRAIENLVRSIIRQGDAEKTARLRTFLEKVFR